MPKTKPKTVENYRNAAQYFTSSAAILYGLLWVVAGIGDHRSESLDNLATVLLWAVVLGGVAMGLLYSLKSSRKK